MNTAAIGGEWLGRIIAGRFTLLKWLGGSASSDVFLTELDELTSQRAAIKLIPANSASGEARIAAWATAAALSHPHLMRLFHSGRCQIDDAELFYIVMEYADEDLSQILPDRPLAPAEAREMLEPVLDALAYLHVKGFAHGHLKPSNIMVVNDGLKLSADSIEAVGVTGVHSPTPSIYVAPERATEAIAPATDVWSLGVTLVEALTQHPPVWDMATQREPEVPESIPAPFAGIAQACLRLDTLSRCTLAGIEAHLEPARHDREPAATTDRTAPSRLPALALAGAVLVVLAVVAILYLRPHKNGSPTPTQDRQPAPRMAAAPPASPLPSSQPTTGPTVKGAIAERVLPNVPQFASTTIQGTIAVKIRVSVDASGAVSNATFQSPGPSRYFANLSMQAARKWTFKPSRVNGNAVSSVWILQFQYRRDSTNAVPFEVSP